MPHCPGNTSYWTSTGSARFLSNLATGSDHFGLNYHELAIVSTIPKIILCREISELHNME